MPEIPQNDRIKMAIEGGEVTVELRPYLGYSEIGHECPRYLWYTFRWMYKKTMTRREYRLLRRGDQEEPVIIRDLEHAGIKCGYTLKDQLEVKGCFGHAKGHPDGVADNVPTAEKTTHLLEFKSANAKRFKEIVRFGMKRSNPIYWAQVTCYMGKLGLTRYLFVVTNKDDDDRHYERGHYDKADFEFFEEKAADIIMAEAPPQRLSSSPEWYACKWCDAYQICHKGAPVEHNCRTCQQSTLLDDGQWGCKTYPDAGAIPEHVQRKGCERRIPLL